jgi:hypothetical protein
MLKPKFRVLYKKAERYGPNRVVVKKEIAFSVIIITIAVHCHTRRPTFSVWSRLKAVRRLVRVPSFNASFSSDSYSQSYSEKGGWWVVGGSDD